MLWRQHLSAVMAISNRWQHQVCLSRVPSLPASATAVIPTHLSLQAAHPSSSTAMPGHVTATSVCFQDTYYRHGPETGHTQRRHVHGAVWPSCAAAFQHSILPAPRAPSHGLQQQQRMQLMGQKQVVRSHAAHTNNNENQVQRSLDAIHIKGARFYGYHGVLPEENAVGQPFVVDISLYLDLQAAGRSDDLQHTVSYAEVFEEVRQVMEGPPHQLLESLAHNIAHKVLTKNAMVHAMRISVSKCHIPKLSAAVSSVGVEVYRTRADFNL